MSQVELAKMLVSIEASIQEFLSKMDQVDSKVAAAEGRFTSMGKAADIAAGIIIARLAREAARATIEAFGETAESAANFEWTLERIVAASGTTGDAANALRADLMETAMAQEALGASGYEAVRAMEAIYKATGDVTAAQEALVPILRLSTIEQIDTARAANLVVQGYTMFGLAAKDAVYVVDELVRASAAGIGTATDYAEGLSNTGASARSMGLSLHETLAALVQLDNTYGSAQESGTFLNRMLIQMTDIYKELGIEIYDASGVMLPFSDIIDQLKEKTDALGYRTQAYNEYISEFDIRSRKAAEGLLGYHETLGDTSDRMDTMSDATNQTNIMMETFVGRQKEAEAQLENTRIEAGKLNAELETMWKEFSASLGPIGVVIDKLGPVGLEGAIMGLSLAFGTAAAGWFKAGGLSMAIKGLETSLGAAGAVVLAAAGTLLVLAQCTTATEEDVEQLKETWGMSMISMEQAVGDLSDLSEIALEGAGVTIEGLGDTTEETVERVDTAWDRHERHLQQVGIVTGDFVEDTEAALEAFEQAHQEAYEEASASLQEYWLDRIDTEKEGWDEVEQEYVEHYDDLLGEMETAHSEQLRELEAFYDEKLALAREDLDEVRKIKRIQLDDLEIWFLEQKDKYQAQYEAQRINLNTFNDKMEKLSREYRERRGEINDTYRLQELYEEREFRDESETIEAERETAIEEMQTTHNQEMAALEGQRRQDMAIIMGLMLADSQESIQDLIIAWDQGVLDIDTLLDILAGEIEGLKDEASADMDILEDNIADNMAGIGTSMSAAEIAAKNLKSAIDRLKSKEITVTTYQRIIRTEELRVIRGDGGGGGAPTPYEPTPPSRAGAPSTRTTTPPMPTETRGGRQFGGVDIFTEPTLVPVAEAGIPEVHTWVPLTGEPRQMSFGGMTIGTMTFVLEFPNILSIEDPEQARKIVQMIAKELENLRYARGRRG